jgi:uncharacterized membrane protein
MSAAAADATAPANTPPRRLMLSLLALSVALNLFFVAGAAWIRLHPSAESLTPEQRYRQMATELGLDVQQRVAFDRYVAAMRARTANMRQQLVPLIGGAWEEIERPQADAAQVMRLLDEAAEKRLEFLHEGTAQTLAFLAVLSPTQRAKFVAIARPRRAPWLHPGAPNR